MRVDTCQTCGAGYEVREASLIMRDRDSFNCNRCGTEMLRWNGAVTYSFIPLSDEDEESGVGEDGSDPEPD